jgi:ASC-1-like (ASCH) protein
MEKKKSMLEAKTTKVFSVRVYETPRDICEGFEKPVDQTLSERISIEQAITYKKN